MDTRVWSKPELIVLGRGAPEENLLHACKSKPSAGFCENSRCATKLGGQANSFCLVQNREWHNS
jgi:hypothetical protein